MRMLLTVVLSPLMLLLTGEVFSGSSVAYGGTQIQQRDRDCLCDCGCACDEDGDGICDICGGCLPIGPDADGDGVPNGQDADYVPPHDGTGKLGFHWQP